MHKNTLLILFTIFLIAFALRVIYLSTLPFSLHTDEVYAGYVGRYLFLHGHDIYGNAFPLYINKFGDFRPVGIFWLSGFSTFIFGINEFAIRFPSSFFGALTVIPLYFLTLELFKNKNIALLSAFLLALLPWHITLSRATSESIIGLFFFVAAIYYMLLFVKKEKIPYILSALGLGLSSYLFYHSFRIIVPLAFLPLLIFAKNKRTKLLSIFSIAILFLVTFGISITSQGSGRFNQVAFYNDTSLTNTIDFLKAGEGRNNILAARIFHNKAIIYGRDFVRLYLAYFSPQFLFDDKGLPTRYVSPEQGLLYYLFIPFLVAALLFFVPYTAKDRKAWLVFYLLAIAVLPAALTYEDSPNISRSAVMIIPLVILGAFGTYAFFTKTQLGRFKKPLLILCCAFFMLEYIYFWHQYSVHAKTFEPYYRNEGDATVIKYVLENKGIYKHIYIPSGDLAIYYLFYANSFERLQPGIIRKIESSGAMLDGITYVPTLCINHLISTGELVVPTNSLVVVGGDCRSVGFKIKETIVRSDGTNAYQVIEIP